MTSTPDATTRFPTKDFPRIPESELKVGDLVHDGGQTRQITGFAELSPQAPFPGRKIVTADGWGMSLHKGDWVRRTAGPGVWFEQI